MKVLLINPSGGYPRHEYPPLGLLYIASVAENAGHSVVIYDEGAINKRRQTLFDAIESYQPDICGISLFTTNIDATFNTIASIKRMLPDCPVVVGGPHATALPLRTMEECLHIDFLVYGEGEHTFRELLENLGQHKPYDQVKGLYYRTATGIVHTPSREWISDLDSLPLPNYALLFDFEYEYDPIRVGTKVATLMTSRGCPYDCTFCAAKAVWGRSFRRRTPHNVVMEIKMLNQDYGFDDFYFMDDLFAINRSWLETFYALLQELDIDIHWKCLGRVDHLNYADYQKMADNGCYLIQLGVESGDNRILKDINKNITTTQVRAAFSDAQHAGLNTAGFFILGHRLDTIETVIKTIHFAKYLKPDFISFFCLVPFPGTKIYEQVPFASKYDWTRIMYSGWGRKQKPIQLSSVDTTLLKDFEWQSHTHVHASLTYLFHNIILARRKQNLRHQKINFFKEHVRLRLISSFTGKWTLGRYLSLDLSSHLNDNSFSAIWTQWLRKTTSELAHLADQHVKERMPFLDLLSRHITESNPMRVLEIGCGTAIDSHYLAKRFPSVHFHAIDISDQAVAIAQKMGNILDSSAVITQGSLEDLPYTDGNFDLIFSQGVMEHFPDPYPGMREQVRVLSPNGELIVNVPQKYNPYTFHKHALMKRGIWEYGWETEYSFFDLKKMGDPLGLSIMETGGNGYAVGEDWGLGRTREILQRWACKKTALHSVVARMAIRCIMAAENQWGHLFMQNITVVYKRK